MHLHLPKPLHGCSPVYRSPHRPWLTDEWETAKSTGVIDHIDRKDATDFEFVCRGLKQLSALQDDETSTDPQINFLSFDDSLQPRSREEALIALSRLDTTNPWIGLIARQMLGTMQSMHLRFEPVTPSDATSNIVTFDEARQKILVALRERYGACVAMPSPVVWRLRLIIVRYAAWKVCN